MKYRNPVSPVIRQTLLIVLACSLIIFLESGVTSAQSPGDETWTPATDSAAFSPRYSQSSVVFDGGSGEAMWVIGGNSVSSGLFNDVWFSRDGVVWVMAANSTEFPARADHSSLVFHDRIWVIGGYGGARTFNDVWQSPDGVHWKEVTGSAAFPVRYGQSSVVFDGKMWVIGGSGDSGDYYNDVWYSADGISWKEATGSAQFPPRYSHTSVVFDNKIWVIGGYNPQAGNMNDVWYSSDGITWKEANNSAAWPARGDHTSLVFDRKMWVMGGSGDGGNFQDIWYSENGELWTQLTGSAFFPARTCHSSLIFGKKAWVIGGWGDTGNLNDVWFTVIPVVPEITAITPAAGLEIVPASVATITGNNFQPGAMVFLNRTGTPDIRATHIDVIGPGELQGEFDLTGRSPGLYNVVVTNPDGQQGILREAFSIIPKGADQTANTTIDGLTVTNCGGTRRVQADTAILPANLSADGSTLELYPPAENGFRNIVLHAADGGGFTRSGNSYSGFSGNVTLETGEIQASGFSRDLGSPVTVHYSLNLPAYPCNALIRTTLWEQALPDDRSAFQRIAEQNGAHYQGTAYSARISGTGLSTAGTTTIRMSLNSSWNPLPGAGDNTLYIEQIAGDKKSGSVLPTLRIHHDPLLNLDYFEATYHESPATFGISSLSGNEISSITVPLEETSPQKPAEKAPESALVVTGTGPDPVIPVDTGQTAILSQDSNGAVTDAVTLQSTDCLARVNVGKGTIGTNPNGNPLSSITIKSVAPGDIPALPPGTGSSFAGRAYELLPEHAAFSPEILISFIAPHGQPGHMFEVRTFDKQSGIWQDIPARYDPETATVTVQVSHFSLFVLFSRTEPSASGGGVGSLTGVIGTQPSDIVQKAEIMLQENVFIIAGIIIITIAIFLRTRKPRRYRILYEK